jgi:hypothetical protein
MPSVDSPLIAMLTPGVQPCVCRSDELQRTFNLIKSNIVSVLGWDAKPVPGVSMYQSEGV